MVRVITEADRERAYKRAYDFLEEHDLKLDTILSEEDFQKRLVEQFGDQKGQALLGPLMEREGTSLINENRSKLRPEIKKIKPPKTIKRRTITKPRRTVKLKDKIGRVQHRVILIENLKKKYKWQGRFYIRKKTKK